MSSANNPVIAAIDVGLEKVVAPYAWAVRLADVLPSVRLAPLASMTAANIAGDICQMVYGVMANAELAAQTIGQALSPLAEFALTAASLTLKFGSIALVAAHLLLSAGERKSRSKEDKAKLDAAANSSNPFIKYPTQFVKGLEWLADAITDQGTFRYADKNGKSRLVNPEWQGLSPEIKNSIGFGIWALYTGIMFADAALKMAALGFSFPLLVPLLIGATISIASLHFVRAELLKYKARRLGENAQQLGENGQEVNPQLAEDANKCGARAGRMFFLAGTTGIGLTLAFLPFGIMTHPALIASMLCFAVGHRALQHFQQQSVVSKPLAPAAG